MSGILLRHDRQATSDSGEFKKRNQSHLTDEIGVDVGSCPGVTQLSKSLGHLEEIHELVARHKQVLPVNRAGNYKLPISSFLAFYTQETYTHR